LPKHALEGHDFNTVWNASIIDPNAHLPIGSGPFLITEWLQGTQMTLTRNPEWWGSSPSLDAVVLRFIPSTSAQVQALRAGELSAIHPPADESLASLQGVPGIASGTSPGLQVEHLDFNTASATMPLLREDWFREAVAYALDRGAAVPAGWGALSVEPRDSLVHFSQQPEYKPVFDRYGYNADKVARIMKRQRCALASDGIWSCKGTRASIRFATTSGNARRARIQERLVLNARAAGIELVLDNSTPAVLFNTRLPARDYELIMFSWVLGWDPSFGLGDLYGCTGANNFMGYCSQQVTKLLEAADVDVSRAGPLNRADAILAGAVPSIPFYQYPLFLAYHSTLQGIASNAGPQGLTWNVEDWQLE
jgi:peptide/nickel transport system substrate-binding protein